MKSYVLSLGLLVHRTPGFTLVAKTATDSALDFKGGDIAVEVVRRIEEVPGGGDLWRIELGRRSGSAAAARRKR